MKPWIDKGTSLASFFNREDEYTDYNEDGNEVAEYNKKSRGFNISFGRQTGEYTRDYLTLESRKIPINGIVMIALVIVMTQMLIKMVG